MFFVLFWVFWEIYCSKIIATVLPTQGQGFTRCCAHRNYFNSRNNPTREGRSFSLTFSGRPSRLSSTCHQFYFSLTHSTLTSLGFTHVSPTTREAPSRCTCLSPLFPSVSLVPGTKSFPQRHYHDCPLTEGSVQRHAMSSRLHLHRTSPTWGSDQIQSPAWV